MATNLLAFGLNTAATFGLGTRGLLGASTNQQVSAALPTLATPAGWAFAIWGPIFLLEGGSMLWRLAGASASDKAVVDASSPAWCAACALQAAWTAAFGFDQLALSVPLLGGISLALSSVYGTARSGLSGGAGSYLLGELPFALHYSWTALASLVNLNLLAVSMHAPARAQVALAAASQLGAVAFGVAESWRRADPVPACVASWALLAISANDGVARARILSGAPHLGGQLELLTRAAGTMGKGLALFGAGMLLRNVLARPAAAGAKDP